MPKVRQSTASPIGNAGSTGPFVSPTGNAPGFNALAGGARSLVSGLAAVAGAKKNRERADADVSRFLAVEAKERYDKKQGLSVDEAGLDMMEWELQWTKENKSLDVTHEDAGGAFDSAMEDAIKVRGLDEKRGEEFRLRGREAKAKFMESFAVRQDAQSFEESAVRISEMTSKVVQLYYKSGDTEQLVLSRDALHENVEKNFKDMPKSIASHLEAIDTNIAEVLVDKDPEIGKQFINESRFISPTNRKTLLAKASSVSESYDVKAALNLKGAVNIHYENAAKGKKFPMFTEDDFVAGLGEKQGKREFQVYERQMGIQKDIAAIKDTYEATGPHKQAELAAKLEAETDPRKKESLRGAISVLSESQKYMRSDPARYLEEGSPTIAPLMTDVLNLTVAAEQAAEEDKPAALAALKEAKTELNREKLRLQGYGTTDHNLNLSSHLHSLIPNDEAKRVADSILKAKPADVIDIFNSVLSEFPDPQHRWIAFEDIVAQGVSFEHVMGYMVKDEPFAETFLLAQRAFEGKAVGKDQETFTMQVQEHPGFVAWQEAASDGGANSLYVDSGAKAIVNYSRYLNENRGMGVDDSIEAAISNVFGSTVFIDAGGGGAGMLMFAAVNEDGEVLSEYDQEILEEFLPQAISRLDIKQVGEHHFTDVAGNFNPEDRLQFIEDVLSEEGNVRFQTDKDGQSGILIGRKSKGGDEFILEDKDGIPFRIHLDDLPRRDVVGGLAKTQRANKFGKPENQSNWPWREIKPGGASKVIPGFDLGTGNNPPL